MFNIPPRLLPIVLLTCSNIFMTFAWYGHLKFKDRPFWLVIILSWVIALRRILLRRAGQPLWPHGL